jgi:hypothetical protein
MDLILQTTDIQIVQHSESLHARMNLKKIIFNFTL